jgi:hypothetical protein
MRLSILIAVCLILVPAVRSAQDPLASLMAFSGTWQVTRKDAAKPDLMVNQCTKTGHYFTCDQSVNGGPSALLVFIPRTDKPGEYYTQNIRPEGRATSRGDLEIKGDTWTFLSNWDNSGRTVYYRTVDTFVSKTRIHYEQAESSNGKDWTVTNSGEEIRTPAKR